MTVKNISDVKIGDMLLRYELDTAYNRAGFYIIPANMKDKDNCKKNCRVNTMVQYKIIGDMYPNSYAQGSSMRNSESANLAEYVSQDISETDAGRVIITHMRDKRGYDVNHVVTYYDGDLSFELHSEIINNSGSDITLEMISSFELGKITPFTDGDAHDTLLLHRLRSKWSHEARLHTETIEDLQLEPSWSTWAVSTERFGQAGSMPVKKFFPFVGVEDKANKVLWGAMIAHEASWQIEAYRQDDGLHISGGIADREFGHWYKTLKPGERFVTPRAILTVCENMSKDAQGIDLLTWRLTQSMQKHADNFPESEQELPIIFNEYCTTWGNPSHENIKRIVEAIKDKGIEYFVIDCGWFKEDGIPWDISMGDYNISKKLFPGGLERTVELINDAGMRAGIWFEIDNIGKAAAAYNNTEHQLMRDGHPVTTYSRRFWDMTDPWVQEYLSEKVIGTLKKYGFGYMKMDYNDTIGIGCDASGTMGGSSSLGENLRKNMEASVDFVKKVNREMPGIILENCASGGHRLEPLMMSITSMSSFSDAHECEEIPIIAANLHRAVLPRQSQIWCVIRKTDSLKRIAYSIAATFLGRMCLSGDITELSEEQWNVIDSGICFYKKIAPIIKKGFTYRYGSGITSERHPHGWQGVVRIGDNGAAYVVVHTFGGTLPNVIEIKLPGNCPQRIEDTYSDGTFRVETEGGTVKFHTGENMKAMAIYLCEK